MMRWLGALLAVCTLWAASPAQAQWLLTVHTAKPVGTCTGGYLGPGDAISGAKEFWGLRAYTCAYAGANGKIMNIIRASDSHTCDVAAATGGGLGNTQSCSTGGENGTAVATWCTSTTCSVVTLYDQSGANQCSSAACDATQATSAKRPTLKFSGCATITGGGPCLGYASASSQTLNTGTTTSIATSTGIIGASVVNFVSPGAGAAIVATSGASSFEMYVGFATTGNRMYDGGTGAGPTQTCSNSVAHSVIGIDRGTNAATSISCDASVTTGAAAGNNGFNGLIGLGSYTSGDYFNGEWEEAGIWAGTASTGLCHNQRIAWGLGGAC